MRREKVAPKKFLHNSPILTGFPANPGKPGGPRGPLSPWGDSRQSLTKAVLPSVTPSYPSGMLHLLVKIIF